MDSTLVPSDSAKCPECGEDFATQDDLHDHYFDAHLLTRSEASHTAAHSDTASDGDASASPVSPATRRYVRRGTVTVAGLLIGLVALSKYYYIPFAREDGTWVSVLMYGLAGLVVLLSIIVAVTELSASRS